ncbi:MAG: glycosyltransferase family 4 protein [Methanobacterium paludis]|nr:glycosyltransferase family 4 protein [Methanobacterium paludis]
MGTPPIHIMKILHVISGGDTGGAKTHLLSLVKELQKSLDIKIICLIPGEFYKEAVELGYNVELLEQKTRLNIGIVKAICRIIEVEHFDILHCHGARANFIGWFIKKKINIPAVSTVHSDINKDFINNIYKRMVFTTLNKIAIRKFNYFIAVSEELKDLLISMGRKENCIFVINNGVDFSSKNSLVTKEEFCNKYSLDCSTTDMWVGIVARLHVVKGHKVFIDAAKEVLKSNPSTTFLIAGDGEELASIEAYINSLDLGKKIKCIGFCKEPYRFINVIDINVLSSFSEGLPYVLLESAASKKVMVSTDVGAIPKLIKDGVSGFLSKPGDSKTLANNILKLLNNEDLRITMGQALYDIGKKDFSIEAMAKHHIDIYSYILNKKGSD